MATPTFLTSTPAALRPEPGIRAVVAARPLASLGPPIALFLLLRVAFALLTPTTVTDFDAATWARFDSGNYTSIATEGYYFESCAERGTPEMGELCSNAAWYPGFPYLTAGVSAFGLSFATAGIVVAQLAALGILVVLWVGFLGARLSRTNLLLLLLAGTFPGGIYLLGMFPLSLLVLLVLIQVYLFGRGRWMAGATVGAAAGVLYPISLVLAPACALWCWLATPERSRSERLMGAAGVGAVVAAGNLIVFALHQIWLGHWDASLIHQRESFGNELRNPAVNLWNVIVDRDSWMQVNGEGVGPLLALQTLLVLTIVGTCAILAWRSYRTRYPGPFTVAPLRGLDREHAHLLGITLVVLAVWALPLVNSIDTGLYRREVAVLPAVILLRRAPTWLVTAFVVVAVPVWALLAQKFYWHVVI